MQSDQGCYGIPRRQSPAKSYFKVVAPNGHGSTATKVRTFSQTAAGQTLSGLSSLPAFDYISDAVNGDRVVIKESGIYFFQYSDSKGTGSPAIGICINEAASSLTNSVVNASNSNLIAYTEPPGGSRQHCTGIYPCTAGDIVRPRDSGDLDSTSNLAFFTICKICD